MEVNLGRSDLSLLKTVVNPPQLPGDTFSYTLAVKNNGQDKSTGFKIVDNLPMWLSYIGHSPTNVCTAAADPNDPVGWGQIVTCNVTQDLAVNQVYYLTLTVQLKACDFNPPWNGCPPEDLLNTACVTGNEYDTDSNNNCGTAYITPTAVDLKWFKATGRPGFVKIGWETANEIDNLGFNLYRAESAEGFRIKINDDLIPTRVPPGSPFGATYIYRDGDVRPGTVYYYWLEDVDIYGHTALHGPVRARMQ